jgi:hypothetical protein
MRRQLFVLVSMNDALVEINNAETIVVLVLRNDASVETLGKLMIPQLMLNYLSHQIGGEIVADGGQCITTLKPVLPY